MNSGYKQGRPEDEERLQLLISAYEQFLSIPASRRGSLHFENIDDHNISIYTEMKYLIWRSFTHFWRNPMALKVRLGQSIFMALILGFLFFQIKHNQSTVGDRYGCLFIMMMNILMTTQLSTMLTFSAEKTIVLREMANNMYSLSPYYISKFVAELPFQACFPIIFSAIAYFLIGLQLEWTKYLENLATMISLTLVGISLGIFVASISSNSAAASHIAPMVIFPFVLFSGIFIQSENIPIYFRWVETISPFQYGYNALNIIEFKGLDLYCTSSELIDVNSVLICPYESGDQVLEYNGIDYNELSMNIMALIIIFASVMTISYIFLYFLLRRRL